MADCKIINEKVSASVTAIQGLAKRYSQTGDTFVSEFTSAIAEMEGDSKDALLELFNNSYKDFVTSIETGLPAMINGLASLLEGNRDNFEKVDDQIAKSIRDGGQQG